VQFTCSPRLRAGCDVLIAGGGIAGVFAALGARQMGAKVLLVERHSILGGDGTAGGVCGLCGDTARVNATFDELVGILQSRGAIAPYDASDDQRAYKVEHLAWALQEMVIRAGVKVLYHTHAADVVGEAGRWTHVLLSTKSGLELQPLEAVVDATGEADLCARAGLPTAKGGDDGLQLPMSLYFTLWDTGKPMLTYLPPGCPQWEGDEDLPMTTLHQHPSGRLDVKMKVIGHDATDADSLTGAELEARKQMMGLVYHLQSKGYQGIRYAEHELAFVSRQVGIREGRRAVGGYVLTEEDVRAGRCFEDAVAVGTYHIDYHWPDRLQRAGTGITDMVPPYHIPLRSLVPAGSRNLLVAGRCISADQMAMSSYRVMATCAQIGFAAGITAALACSHGGDAGCVPYAHVHKALAAGGQRLDLAHYGEYLSHWR